MASRKCHVYRVKLGDWRVRVKFHGKWRDHGGSFPTKEQAEAHCRSISGEQTSSTKRSKPKRRTKKRKRVGRRRKLLGRVRKTRARLRRRRRPVMSLPRTEPLRPGDRFRAPNGSVVTIVEARMKGQVPIVVVRGADGQSSVIERANWDRWGWKKV